VSCLGRGIKLPPFCDQAVTVTRTLTLQRLGSRLPRPAAPLSADAGLPRSGVLAATVAGASPDPSTAAPSSASPLTSGGRRLALSSTGCVLLGTDPSQSVRGPLIFQLGEETIREGCRGPATVARARQELGSYARAKLLDVRQGVRGHLVGGCRWPRIPRRGAFSCVRSRRTGRLATGGGEIDVPTPHLKDPPEGKRRHLVMK